MIRVRHATLGAHVHMRVFVGQENDGALALSGTLVMRPEEFEEFQRLAAVQKDVAIHFIPEREEVRDVG